MQDIQVFCINETELMGFDNIKCNKEVFSEINSREQDPIQKLVKIKGVVGKWAPQKANGKRVGLYTKLIMKVVSYE